MTKTSPSPTGTPLIARLNALDGWSSREVWDATVKEAATALQSSESDLERARGLLREALDGWDYALNRAADKPTMYRQRARIAEIAKFLEGKGE